MSAKTAKSSASKPQPGSTTAAIWVAPLPNIRSVHPISVAAGFALHHVDNLIMIVPAEAGCLQNLLFVLVDVATCGKKPIGQAKAVAIAVKNVSGQRRWSKLDEWLRRPRAAARQLVK
jgi:hypothetical protein